jgi:hypothetical protein
MQKTAFICEYDPSLDDDEKNDPNPFPEKMAWAIATIEKHGVPPGVKRTKKGKKQHKKDKKAKKLALSTLQNELLNVYTFDPTEQQMQQLKDFLAQLFPDKLQVPVKQEEEEMVA